VEKPWKQIPDFFLKKGLEKLWAYIFAGTSATALLAIASYVLGSRAAARRASIPRGEGA